jgi:MSHA biogenesis protein MshI
LPLAGISVFGGARSADLAVWLSQELGMVVMPMDLEVLYPRVAEVNTEDLIACLPLLGILLRDDGATG